MKLGEAIRVLIRWHTLICGAGLTGPGFGHGECEFYSSAAGDLASTTCRHAVAPIDSSD
jgi:hypothetical protein